MEKAFGALSLLRHSSLPWYQPATHLFPGLYA